MDISVTDIRTWKECPRQALILQNLPRQEKAGPARVGIAAHAVMASYVEHLWKTQQVTDLEFARRVAGEVAAKLSPRDEADFRSFIFAAIDGMTNPVLGAKEVIVERRMHLCIECMVALESIPAVGHEAHDTFSFTPDIWFVDANGFGNIWDWKSGHVIGHVDHPDEQFQLDMYLGAMMKITGCAAGYVHLYHLRHGEHEQSGWAGIDQPPTPKLAQWLVPRFEIQAREAALGMHGSELRAMHQGHGVIEVYGSHCADCGAKPGCQSYEKRVASPQDDLAPEALVNNVTVLDERVKAGKDRIKKALNGAAGGVILGSSHEAALSDVERSAHWSPEMFHKLKDILPESDLLELYQPTEARLLTVLKKHRMAEAADTFKEAYKHATLSTDLRIRRRTKRAAVPAAEDGGE